MNKWPRFPLLLEINAMTWLKSLSEKYHKTITLGTIPGEEFDQLDRMGIHAAWFMGVWQRSSQAREIAGSLAELKKEYNASLPGYSAADVAGSPYAVKAYRVDAGLGDAAQLALAREQLHQHNIRLILDFVPNHFAIDHPWIRECPELLVQGTEQDLKRSAGVYFAAASGSTPRIFAHGRAPLAPPWTDTVQIDYRKRAARDAMAACLLTLAAVCDGVRCDMAMLLMKDRFLKTWSGKYEEPAAEFWAGAVAMVKEQYPDFLFIGEVYWDYEYRLQKQGFDFVYDKVLYDRVLGNHPRAVYEHLYGGTAGFQSKLVRFIENHDEKRVVAAVGREQSLAAATLVFTAPGMHLIHEGQSTGNKIKLPVQLGRRPAEKPDQVIAAYYEKLLAAIRSPVFQEGYWELLAPQEAALCNSTFRSFVAFMWSWQEQIKLITANLSPEPAQCFLPLDENIFAGKTWLLEDQLNPDSYVRNGDVMAIQGLFLDMKGYGYHLFTVKEA